MLRAPKAPSTVWLGEFIEVFLPEHLVQEDQEFALEPNRDFLPHTSNLWPIQQLFSFAGIV